MEGIKTCCNIFGRTVSAKLTASAIARDIAAVVNWCRIAVVVVSPLRWSMILAKNKK